MADKEHCAESIKYSTELLRLTWITLLAIGGGSLSLLLGEPTTIRLALASGGLLGIVGLLLIGWRLDRHIRIFINRVKELP